MLSLCIWDFHLFFYFFVDPGIQAGGGGCALNLSVIIVWAPVDLISMLFSGVVSSAYLVIIFCHDEVLHFLDQLDSLFY